MAINNADGNVILEEHRHHWYANPLLLLANFLVVAICLSANHGTVTAFIALTSTELGPRLGGISLGLLFAAYTISALTFSSYVVMKIGPKWSMVWSLCFYCVYVASFLLAVEVPSLQIHSAIFGSVIGGIAAGWMWTAQGALFARVAHLYALFKGIPYETATAWLAGIFATIYVGLEVMLKFLMSLLIQTWGKTTTFIIYTSVAVICTGLLAIFGKDPPVLQREKKERNTSKKELLLAAVRLLWNDRRMQLLSAMNMTFGFAMAFMNIWVTGVVVMQSLGEENVGYLAAVSPAVATIVSMPLSWLSKKTGKGPIMTCGGLVYLTMSLATALTPLETLISLKWGLAFIFALSGIGRAVFESTNKAIVADFFKTDHEAAFSSVIILSGSAGAFSSFVFPQIPKLYMILIVGTSSLMAVISVPIAFRIHHKHYQQQQQQGQQEYMPLAQEIDVE